MINIKNLTSMVKRYSSVLLSTLIFSNSARYKKFFNALKLT